VIEIAESPISKTGNSEWDDTFNECFYENAKTVMWPHSCMHDGYIYVARGEECSWCGGKEEDEPQGENVVVPILKL
jgi:hypothetical protein